MTLFENEKKTKEDFRVLCYFNFYELILNEPKFCLFILTIVFMFI